VNNRIECDHGRLKARLRPMRGLKRDRSARVIMCGHAFMQNLRRGHYELGLDARPHRRIETAITELARAHPTQRNSAAIGTSAIAQVGASGFKIDALRRTFLGCIDQGLPRPVGISRCRPGSLAASDLRDVRMRPIRRLCRRHPGRTPRRFRFRHTGPDRSTLACVESLHREVIVQPARPIGIDLRIFQPAHALRHLRTCPRTTPPVCC